LTAASFNLVCPQIFLLSIAIMLIVWMHLHKP
jgi:hypothetical protein